MFFLDKSHICALLVNILPFQSYSDLSAMIKYDLIEEVNSESNSESKYDIRRCRPVTYGWPNVMYFRKLLVDCIMMRGCDIQKETLGIISSPLYNFNCSNCRLLVYIEKHTLKVFDCVTRVKLQSFQFIFTQTWCS